jgi:hypothetical protein
MDALSEALRLLDGAASLYPAATPHVRRLLNDSLFVALYVINGEVGFADPAPWISALQELSRSTEDQSASSGRKRAPTRLFLGRGLNKTNWCGGWDSNPHTLSDRAF